MNVDRDIHLMLPSCLFCSTNFISWKYSDKDSEYKTKNYQKQDFVIVKRYFEHAYSIIIQGNNVLSM